LRNYKLLLASFIEVITFLLASFGGFLKNVAPPDQVGASFPVGVLSFLALILLMIISAISRNAPTKKSNRRWIAAGIGCFTIAVPSAFIYQSMLGRYTYPQSQELSKRHIAASDEYLTPDAQRFKGNKNMTADELVQNLPDGDVWTQEGIGKAQLRLLTCYSFLVLSVSAAVFCLLEANMRGSGKDKSSKEAGTRAESSALA
jgi:hypothetical protein